MKTTFKNIARVLLGTIASLLLVLIVLIALVRLPSFQNYITHRATAFISGKTHTKIELKRLYIGFPKSVIVEGLFAEDLKHDTLIAVRQLEIDIDLPALLHRKINVNSLLLAGFTGHIVRTMPDSIFNFSFFLKAFSSNTPKKNIPQNTTASPWKIAVNRIELNRINATFSDAVSGNDMQFTLNKLQLNVKDMDMSPLRFNMGKLFISGANVSIIMDKASPKTADTATVKLPLLALDQLDLQDIRFYFGNKISRIFCSSYVKDFSAKPGNIDLNGQQIKVNTLKMSGAAVGIAIQRSEDTVKTSTKEVATVMYKGWKIEAGRLLLDKTSFRFDITNVAPQPDGMDYSHMYFTGVKADIKDALYTPERIAANIQHLSLQEKCGLDLKELSTKAVYDDRHSELANLSVITAHSHISNYVMASYPSITSLSRAPGELGIQANLLNTSVAVNDVLLFAPMLKKQPLFANKRGQVISVNGKVNGFLKNFTAENIVVRMQDSTVVMANGHVTGLPDAQRAVYEVKLKNLVTIKKDVLALLPDSSLRTIVNMPGKITLSGNFKGSFTDFTGNLLLHTSAGDIMANASMKTVNRDTQYVAVINTKELNLGYLLKQPVLLGPVTQRTTITGKNFALKNLQAHVVTEINTVVLNSYRYRNIVLDASADCEKYTAKLSVKDSNLAMTMSTDISTVDKQEAILLQLNLEGAALGALNLSSEDVRTSGRMNINLKGKKVKDLNGRASLSNVLVIKNDKKYRTDSLVVVSVNDKKHSAFKMKSAMLNVDYEGTLTLLNLNNALKHHIDKYFNITHDKETAEKDTSEQDFKVAVNILPHPIINEVLFPKLQRFNGVEIKGDFSNRKQELNLAVSIPAVRYGSQNLDNMLAEIHSDKNAMNYSVTFDNLKSNTIEIAQTNLSGVLQKNNISFGLKINDKDKKKSKEHKLWIAGNILQEKEEKYTLRFDSKNLVLNNTTWQLPADNYIRFGSAGFYVHEMVMSNDKQLLSAQSEPESEGAPLKIIFKQFELGTVSHIIEKDTAIVRGTLNGTVELRNLQKAPAFVSDLKIDNLVYIQNPIGNIQLKADNLSQNTYTAQLILNGFDNDVQVKGSYTPSDNTNQLNFTVDIKKLNLKSVESFTAGQLRRSSGYIAGNLKIGGTGSKPLLNGDIGFKDAAFNIRYINNYVSLKDEHIRIDPRGVYFNAFKILDSLGQKAVITGNVYTTNFTSMKYDLNIQTTNFTVLNTRARDNPLYYGHILLNSTIKIKGDELLPVIDARVKLLGGTNITVVVPSSKINVDKGEGVVELTDTATIIGIMNRVDSTGTPSVFKGLDLTADIEVTKQTAFKIIVDKTTGDSLVVKGEGQLSFAIDPGGKQSLTGTYRLSDGGYKTTFKEVIKREFKIKPGSTIEWNGNPTDATVDITAIYWAKTSPMDLMSTELAGSTAAEINAYRKLLHFDVEMNMKGSLMKPQITFALDMADKDKNAFGGQVYSKITALNSGDAGELNKQVFALLVLNNFIPSGPAVNAGDGGGTVSTLARNSVNQVLADQLNSLSGRYVKEVELNFDIQSNDEYSGTSVQQNTAVNVGLKKEFLQRRVSVQVGSSINVQNGSPLASQESANNLSGDAVVEYRVTDDGRYRLKAFRENQYDGLIDGLLYITGMGIIYTHDFDSFKDIMMSKKDHEIKEEKQK